MIRSERGSLSEAWSEEFTQAGVCLFCGGFGHSCSKGESGVTEIQCVYPVAWCCKCCRNKSAINTNCLLVFPIGVSRVHLVFGFLCDLLFISVFSFIILVRLNLLKLILDINK